MPASSDNGTPAADVAPPSSTDNSKAKIVAKQRRLPSSASGYTLREQIGQGTAASVYRALCVPLDGGNPVEVAVKVIDLEWLQASLDDIWKEISVMSLSSHSNVVPLSTAFVNGADLWVVMPLLTGGSMLELMHECYPNGLPEASAVYVIHCVLKAVDYFHSNNQIHRDIKAANILLTSTATAMLSDYGMMGWMVEGGWERKQRQTFVGTPCWMAPEVMEQTEGYDYKADIWSLGITAIEIAQGMAPYANCAPMKVLIKTLQNPPPTIDESVADRFSDVYKDFVAKCLQREPTNRPTAAQLLQHPLFAKGVQKPTDIEDALVRMPPIGQRTGTKDPTKQLYQQITKNHAAVTSGIFELSAKGQGWDFGDGDLSVPNSSSDTLNTVNTDEAEGKSGKIGNSNGGFTSSRLSERSDSATAVDHLANGPIMDENSPGSTSMAAKTVGMLKKGRFTVSDVGDKVETRIADFLDDDSSNDGISNSSSFSGLPTRNSSPEGENVVSQPPSTGTGLTNNLVMDSTASIIPPPSASTLMPASLRVDGNISNSSSFSGKHPQSNSGSPGVAQNGHLHPSEIPAGAARSAASNLMPPPASGGGLSASSANGGISNSSSLSGMQPTSSETGSPDGVQSHQAHPSKNTLDSVAPSVSSTGSHQPTPTPVHVSGLPETSKRPDGNMSNSSSLSGIAPSHEGSPSSIQNGPLHTSKSVPAASTTSGLCASAMAASASAVSLPATSGLAPATTSGLPPSVAIPNMSSTLPTVTTSAGLSGPGSGASVTPEDASERIRKSRFEVYDIKSGTRTQTPSLKPTAVPKSGTSTPNNSDGVYSSKPKSRGRFEVKDILPKTAKLTAPTGSGTPASGVSAPKTSSPHRANIAAPQTSTPSVITPSTQKQTHISQPSVLQQPAIVPAQVSASAVEVSRPVESTVNLTKMSPDPIQQPPSAEKPPAPQTTHSIQAPLDPRQPASRLRDAGDVPHVPRPQALGTQYMPPNPLHSDMHTQTQPQAHATRVHATPPQYVPSAQLQAQVPSQLPHPHAMPTAYMPTQTIATPVQHHVPVAPGMQSELGYQALAGVTSIHNNLLSLLSEHNRVLQQGSAAATPVTATANASDSRTDPGNVAGQTADEPSGRIRKSRFEVFDVNSKVDSKPVTPGVHQSSVTHSWASTSNQSGGMNSAARKSKARFEVKDTITGTPSTLPPVSSVASGAEPSSISPQKVTVVPHSTPSVQSNISQKQAVPGQTSAQPQLVPTSHAEPSLASRTEPASIPRPTAGQPSHDPKGIVEKSHRPHTAQTTRTRSAGADPRVGIARTHTPAPQAGIHDTSSSERVILPQMPIARPMMAPYVVQPTHPAGMAHQSLHAQLHARNPYYGTLAAVSRLHADIVTLMQEQDRAMQETLHPQLHAQLQATQARYGLQALAGVSALHTSVLGLMQEHDRVVAENEYLRSSLSSVQRRFSEMQRELDEIVANISGVQPDYGTAGV